MYYSVHLDYNVLFGGGNTSQYLIGLILIAVVKVVINTVIRWLKPVRVMDADTAAVPLMMM